jgi:quinolinate synthase
MNARTQEPKNSRTQLKKGLEGKMAVSIQDRIAELKKKRNAVILVHNYQPAEVQDIGDFVGDSLDLSRKAAASAADVIVFCGVHFMAETASILCPDKTVLLPDIASGCPMADMITAGGLRELKKKHPAAVVVAYVNTSAEVKTEADVCCTSANAEAIVRKLDAAEIIFVPDRNLGQYVAAQTGKKMIYWDGYCPVHARILAGHVIAAKKRYPAAEVMVHPECSPEVTALADKVLSTTGMCRYAKESPSAEIIVGTEIGILHRLAKENPGKTFHPVSEIASCVNMKKNSLEKVLAALEEMKHVVRVDEETRRKAKKAIDRMIA